MKCKIFLELKLIIIGIDVIDGLRRYFRLINKYDLDVEVY